MADNPLAKMIAPDDLDRIKAAVFSRTYSTLADDLLRHIIWMEGEMEKLRDTAGKPDA